MYGCIVLSTLQTVEIVDMSQRERCACAAVFGCESTMAVLLDPSRPLSARGAHLGGHRHPVSVTVSVTNYHSHS